MSEVIGYATVQLIPSFDGLEAKANAQLVPAMTKTSEDSGKKSGGIWGNGFMTTVGHVMVAAGLYQIGQSIASGIGKGITTGLQTASFMQQAQISLETLLGSGGQAQTLLTQLSTFAARTPFSLPGVITGTQQLLGAGAAAAGVIPTMTALGDTEAALGGSQDDLSHTMVAWTQLMTRGKIDTQDLLQISNQGIPIWQELAKALGKPTSAIQDLVASGSLASSTTLPLLQAQLEKDYGGSMAKQAQTLAGVWSTVKDTISQALGQAFLPLAPVLASILPGAAQNTANAILGISHGIQGMVGFFKTVSGTIGATFGPAFSAMFSAVGAAVSPFVSTISGAFKAIGPSVAQLLPAFSPFSTVLKSLLPLVAPIAGFFAQLAASILPQLAPILAQGAAVWETLSGVLGSLVATALPVLTKLLSQILPIITPLIGALLKMVTSALTPFWQATQQIVSLLGGALMSIFKTLAAAVLPLIMGLFKQFMPIVMSLVKAFEPLITTLTTALVPAIMSIITALLPPLMSLFKALLPILMPIIGAIGQIALVLAQILIPIIKALMPIVTTVINVIVSLIKPLITIITGVINVIAGVLTGNWKQAWNGIKQIFSGIWNLILAILKGAWDIIVSIFKAIGPTIAALWNGAWKILGIVVSTAWKTASTIVGNGIKTVVGFIAGIGAKIAGVAKSAWTWLTGLASNLWNGFVKAWNKLVAHISDMFVKPFQDALGALLNLFGIHSPSTVMRDVAGHLADGFTAGLGAKAGAIQDAYGVFGAPDIATLGANVTPGGIAGALGTGSDAAGLQPVHVDAATVLDLIQQVADGRIQLYAKKGAQTIKAGRLY